MQKLSERERPTIKTSKSMLKMLSDPDITQLALESPSSEVTEATEIKIKIITSSPPKLIRRNTTKTIMSKSSEAPPPETKNEMAEEKSSLLTSPMPKSQPKQLYYCLPTENKILERNHKLIGIPEGIYAYVKVDTDSTAGKINGYKVPRNVIMCWEWSLEFGSAHYFHAIIKMKLKEKDITKAGVLTIRSINVGPDKWLQSAWWNLRSGHFVELCNLKAKNAELDVGLPFKYYLPKTQTMKDSPMAGKKLFSKVFPQNRPPASPKTPPVSFFPRGTTNPSSGSFSKLHSPKTPIVSASERLMESGSDLAGASPKRPLSPFPSEELPKPLLLPLPNGYVMPLGESSRAESSTTPSLAVLKKDPSQSTLPPVLEVEADREEPLTRRPS